MGLKTAEGRHEALLAILRTTPASLFTPVLRSAPLPHFQLNPHAHLLHRSIQAVCAGNYHFV